MLKRFTLNDVINFAYYAAIACVMALVLQFILFTGLELYYGLTGLGRDAQLNTWANFITMYMLSFIYLICFHPIKSTVQEPLSQGQDPDYLTLREELSEMYLLAEMLDSRITGLQKDAMDHMNDYLHSFLIDDNLFEDLATQDTMAVLRHILAATYVNTPNKNLANVRLVNLMKELKKLNNISEKA